jgi:hypothetical protein
MEILTNDLKVGRWITYNKEIRKFAGTELRTFDEIWQRDFHRHSISYIVGTFRRR